MNLSVGIVGLPNVGKSTLFNALLKKQAALAANYPFATIEPNVGVVPVPDERLEKLAEITAHEIVSSSSTSRNDELVFPPIKEALVEFVDIAGLVKGASEGEGLGNKFLSHIREVKIIAHVVRVFEDENVIKEGAIDPLSDYKTIRTELGLSDLQTIENSKRKIEKSKENIILKLEKALNENIDIKSLDFTKEEIEFVNSLSLLSAKPEIIVLNVSENEYQEKKFEGIVEEYSRLLLPVTASEARQSQGIASSQTSRNDNIIVVSAKIESELANLDENEQKEYLKELGVEKSGLERLIQKAYEKLGLISFLTAGEKEVRAWTIKKGANAVDAAGEIHTDFMQKFIKAEVVSYPDFVEYNGWKGAREKGKARLEGKDYVMQDGDIVEFKIGR